MRVRAVRPPSAWVGPFGAIGEALMRHLQDAPGRQLTPVRALVTGYRRAQIAGRRQETDPAWKPSPDRSPVALTKQQVDAFVASGFVRLDGGVPAQIARRCRDELWLATGYDPQDSSTWTDTLVRLGSFAT